MGGIPNTILFIFWLAVLYLSFVPSGGHLVTIFTIFIFAGTFSSKSIIKVASLVSLLCAGDGGVIRDGEGDGEVDVVIPVPVLTGCEGERVREGEWGAELRERLNQIRTRRELAEIINEAEDPLSIKQELLEAD